MDLGRQRAHIGIRTLPIGRYVKERILFTLFTKTIHLMDMDEKVVPPGRSPTMVFEAICSKYYENGSQVKMDEIGRNCQQWISARFFVMDN